MVSKLGYSGSTGWISYPYYLSFCIMRERNRSGLGEDFTPEPRAYEAPHLQAEFERAEQELPAFDARDGRRVFIDRTGRGEHLPVSSTVEIIAARAGRYTTADRKGEPVWIGVRHSASIGVMR